MIKSYEQISNFIIRKFKRYFLPGKRLKKNIVGKGEVIDGNGVSDPQKTKNTKNLTKKAILAPKGSKISKVQKWCQNGSTVII